MQLYLIKAEIKKECEKDLLDIFEGRTKNSRLEFFLSDAKVEGRMVSFSYTSLNINLSEDERKGLETYFDIKSISEIKGYYRLRGESLIEHLKRLNVKDIQVHEE